MVFTKIIEKTRTYGDFDENFQKFARHLRVKGGVIYKYWDAIAKVKVHL